MAKIHPIPGTCPVWVESNPAAHVAGFFFKQS